LITSASNPKIKLVRALQARRSERKAEQAFVVEGLRLAEEAVRAEVPARLVLHTDHLDGRGRAAVNQLARLGATVETVTPEVMAAASNTQTPSGLLAVLALPAATPPKPLTWALVLDRLADPGNLGTVLRTASAAGVQAAFLAPGTVDAYNPKVVRAAAGAHFQMPIIEAGWGDIASALARLTLWRAEAHTGTAYDQVDWRQPAGLVIGSEAAGPGDAAQRLAPDAVHIPMPGQAESLNAAIAAAVLLFEAARQRRAESRD
jgi:RNA methyltransferase, TrmH family